ncbi:MAG: beta strand repeat-containing protein, partial [Chthoniobacteraceae bacterium]
IVELGAGNLTVTNGGASTVQSNSGGTINATGGGSIVLGSDRGDIGTAGDTTLTINAKITGAAGPDFYNANGGTGLGTIVLAAANDYTGATQVENMRVAIPAGGAINAANTAGVGVVRVATVGGALAELHVNGGTINANGGGQTVNVGTASGANGALDIDAGTINAGEVWIGGGEGSFGSMQMSGGTFNANAWFVVGRNSNGTAEQSGGTLNVTNRNYIVASTNVRAASHLTGDAVVNVTGTGGGNGSVFVGEAHETDAVNGEVSIGELTISGNAQLNISGPEGIFLGNNAGGNGTVNFNGGTVTAFGVKRGAGSGFANFDGGTLVATAENFSFIQGLDAAYVNEGGVVIDDGGNSIEIAQPLLAPTGNGIASIPVTGGTGYLGAPNVEITGDGSGATAIANIDATGNLTGFTITNPGVGYTEANVFISGGGGFGDLIDVPVLAPNVSGGFTKRGGGTVTLSGENTYTGATVVEAGTLVVMGSIAGSKSITTKAGATLNVVTFGTTFAVANGQTLGGSGTVVGDTGLSAGAKLAPGDAGAGTLTFEGDLDLTLAVTPANSGALEFELGSLASSDKIAFASGGLTIGTGVLGFGDFAFTGIAGLAAGTYTLFDGNTPITGTLDAANLEGSFGGGAFLGTLGFADSGNDLVLTVVPEPGSATLLLAGLSSVLGLRRFRRRSA